MHGIEVLILKKHFLTTISLSHSRTASARTGVPKVRSKGELTSHRTRSLLRVALLGLFQERLELVIIERHRPDGLEQFVRTQSLVRDHLGEELGAQIVALLQQERSQTAQQAKRCSQEERVSVDQVEVPDAEGAFERECGTEEREEPGQEVDAAVEADVLEVRAEVGQEAHEEVVEHSAVSVELQRSRPKVSHSRYFTTGSNTVPF